LIEELTSDHQPQVWYFENPQGSSGFPYCPMPPVSDPENWNWTTWSFAPMIGFAMHNAPYRITVQWRYGVYMKGQRGPFQTSITIHVQNLVVTSDPRKLIKWDPEHPELCDTTLSYSLQCAQRKQVTVKIKIYSVEGWQGMELSDTFIYPDKSSDTVDLAPLFGTWQLPKGLYTFDIQVTGTAPYDRDSLRSNAVIIPHVEARLMKIGLTTRAGVINGDYCLCSDRDAKQVFVSFYDPTFDQPMFPPTYPSDYRRPRILHEVTFTGRLNYAWVYWILVEAQDDHPEANKVHERRWALPLAGVLVVPSCTNFAFVADVDTSSDARNDYIQLGAIWDPYARDYLSCYSGFYPLGERGGVVINASKDVGMTALQEDVVFSYTHHAWFNWLPMFNPAITVDDIQNLPDGALSQLLLAVLSGCKTAAVKDDLGNWVYNITQAIVDKGAKVAVGFREEVLIQAAFYFDERLWYYLTKNGNNVTAAVYYAKEDTEGKYGVGSSGEPVRVGDGTTVLYPARWAP
jgi:uncharacterized membrane protein